MEVRVTDYMTAAEAAELWGVRKPTGAAILCRG